MGHRIAELLATESIATAGTKSIDLNLNDVISRITVQLRLRNNNSVPTAHPATAISKIEVVDGSDLLFSLSGKECSALNFYDKGYLPYSLVAYENNIYSTVEFHLDFGRYLWDKILALDPNKFNNLQIRITHDLITGASTPDGGWMSVIAHVFDNGDISPNGFLMSKQVYSYALSATGQERIVLPADYDYRKILFGSHSVGNSPTSQISTVTLSVDNGRRVLINNMSVADLVKMLAPAKAVESFIAIGTASEVTYFVVTTYEQIVLIGPMENTLAATVTVNNGSGGQVKILSDSNKAFQAITQGYAPHGLIALEQGDQNDPTDWLKASEAGNIALILTAGSAVGSASTAEAILQQLRTY